MNYILIDRETRAPIPLPFHTQLADEQPITIVNFHDSGEVSVRRNGRSYRQPPQMFGLELITEEAFIREREQ